MLNRLLQKMADNLLATLYYDVGGPAGYSGVDNLWKEAQKLNPRIKRNEVKNFLDRQYTYSVHKPAKKNFKRGKLKSFWVDSHWQIDLCDMQKLSRYNDGYKYIFTCVDVFSKFSWARPLKDKKPESAKKAFEDILKGGRQCAWLYSDKGGEFIGKPFQQMLLRNQISHYIGQSSETKCPVVERYNRTLKARLYKYFTEYSTFKWINVLQKLVNALNHSYHTSIKCAPVEVTKQNEGVIRETLYGVEQLGKKLKNIRAKYSVGDEVRISLDKGPFRKGYLRNWSSEIFFVHQVWKRRHNPTLYKLKDQQDEIIEGVFYEDELSPAVKRNPILRRNYGRRR